MNEFQMSQNGMGGDDRRIAQKVGRVVVIMLAASIVSVVVLCVVMSRTLAMSILKERCVTGTEILAYELERSDGSGDVNEMLDELKDRMGCEFTIFEGDTRVYTTVIQDGERVVGTKLSSDISEIVLQQGKDYVGKAEILGEKYLCSYAPVTDESGKASGLIFAGISSEQANREMLLAVILSGVVGVVAIIICLFILIDYLKKKVSAPLSEITKTAERLEQGNLGLADGQAAGNGIYSGDEIGTLGRIFDSTTRRLGSYIGEISSVLDSIAEGDLTNSVRQEYIGDFTSIQRSLERISDKLNDTMSQIRDSAEQVSDGSEQVSSSAQDLAQGATEQASAVQELIATMSEISGNAGKTAEATREAGRYVEKAGAQLGISMEYVKSLNAAMERISNTSEEISKIIAASEDIASQTNLLALNAAVEAARAGDVGKGFAVVASEVRNLANKSDEAAKATRKLIEGSIAAVTEGIEVVNKVTESLELTNENAGGVSAQMAAVVEAVENQTSAISQVTEGIDQISAVVQTNSATSEESAAASEELSAQAGLLKELVEAFRLK